MEFKPDNFLRIIGLIVSGLNPAVQRSFRALIGDKRTSYDQAELENGLREYSNLVSLLNDKDQITNALEQLTYCSKRGISAVVLGEPHYPERLSHIVNPPLILYHRGELSSEIRRKTAVAMVGAREADLGACQIAREFAKQLADRGVCIISGLAIGIDSAAHTGALEAALPATTVAVLANGLDTIYPARNYLLARLILDRGGVLLSQYRVDQKPFRSNFLERNLTIAGLADAVLVVSAAVRSGSLVTARFGLEENRDVMAVPGAPDNRRARGCNNLIKEGAFLVDQVEDIITLLGLEQPGSNNQDDLKQQDANFSKTQQELIKLLRRDGTLHYASFPAYEADPTQFAQEVLELELSGVVERLPGNYLRLVKGGAKG